MLIRIMPYEYAFQLKWLQRGQICLRTDPAVYVFLSC